MRFFSIKLLDKRNYLLLYCTILFLSGIVFGSYLYTVSNDWLIHMFSKLIFINIADYTNDLSFYMICTSIYIVCSIICSTSFIGIIMNGFFIFSKAIQIIFSMMFIFFNIEITTSVFILVILPQVLIEVLFVFVLTIICSKLSINTFMVSFIVKDNFKLSHIVHYLLDYTIVILVLVVISMAFRVYVIG